MQLATTSYEHIALDDQDVALISHRGMKVIELQFQYPRLSLGQIHSALAYYWDHKPKLDRQILERAGRIQALEAQMPTPDIVERLRAMRLNS